MGGLEKNESISKEQLMFEKCKGDVKIPPFDALKVQERLKKSVFNRFQSIMSAYNLTGINFYKFLGRGYQLNLPYLTMQDITYALKVTPSYLLCIDDVNRFEEYRAGYISLGDILHYIYEENTMSDVELAKTLECSTTSLGKVRHDGVLPARKFIYNLAKQFNLDINNLYGYFKK